MLALSNVDVHRPHAKFTRLSKGLALPRLPSSTTVPDQAICRSRRSWLRLHAFQSCECNSLSVATPWPSHIHCATQPFSKIKKSGLFI